MFVLFVLRQWGQRVNRNVYAIMAIGLIAVLEDVFNNCGNKTDIKSNKKVDDGCCGYKNILNSFVNKITSIKNPQ